VRKLSRWFRKTREERQREREKDLVKVAEQRLKAMIESGNPEVMEAVRRVQDAGMV
jgi:hypothetical protein